MYQSFPQKRMCRSSSAMPVITRPAPSVNDSYEKCDEKEEKNKIIEKCEENNFTSSNFLNDIFKNIELDDIIIIGIILLLLSEGSEDWLTIGLLIVVLLF